MMAELLPLFISLVLFLLSALPLHKAVRIVKRKSTYSKALLITFIAGVTVALLNAIIPYFLGLLSVFTLLIIYKRAYKLTWNKALFVWILQVLFVIISATIIEIILRIFFNIPSFF